MPIINNIIPERIQNKTMEKEKLYWINGYLTCAMKDNNLPYGIEYLNFLADKLKKYFFVKCFFITTFAYS